MSVSCSYLIPISRYLAEHVAGVTKSGRRKREIARELNAANSEAVGDAAFIL